MCQPRSFLVVERDGGRNKDGLKDLEAWDETLHVVSLKGAAADMVNWVKNSSKDRYV